MGWFVSACDSLFYYPDPDTHFTPDKVNLRFKSITLTEADGTRLALWHILPEGRERRAVVIQFHGNAENMTTHFLFVGWLAEQGFDVVTFDYRGYGSSSGTPERHGLVADGRAVVDWALAQAEFSGKDVFLFGQSLGGAVVLPVAVATPPYRLAGVITESTFDSYRDLARTKLADMWLTWPFQWPLSYLVSDDFSPVEAAPRLTVPFLMIHGTGDTLIPLRHGKRLFEACGSKDKEFWEVPGGAHTAAFGEDDSIWRDRLVDWLSRHLRRR